jgi:hypothetical protein
MGRGCKPLIVLCYCLLAAACAEKPVDMTSVSSRPGELNLNVHGGGSTVPSKPAKTPVVDAVKISRLNGHPEKTLGEAFDTYGKCNSQDWQEDVGRDGRYYVDYFCWIDNKGVLPGTTSSSLVVKRGVNIKFVIHESGEAYIALAAKLQMQGDKKIHTDFIGAAEVRTIIDAIYANQDLIF